MMHFDLTKLNIYLAIWGAIGPLAGILVGHWLSRSWQREQWELDCRKEEFKELIFAIGSATIELMMYIHSQGSRLPQPESLYLDAHRIAAKTIISRIYIVSEIKKLDLADRYLTIGDEIRESGASSEALSKMNGLIDEVVAVAIKG
ncbi:MAG TPA: hypothetical protein VKR52_04540 [Terracidiphilus sp.]|nr:hypothetical protein [Terracidiphilus sp.]